MRLVTNYLSYLIGSFVQAPSVFVPVWVLRKPVPSRSDNCIGVLIFRVPAKQFLGARGVGVERDRVAGPSGLFVHWHFLARDLFSGGDDLPIGKTVARAQVANDRLSRRQALHRGNVRV